MQAVVGGSTWSDRRLSEATLIRHSFFVTGSVSVVHREWSRFGDRVFWVRSTQAMCASAAGAGPAVPKSEDFPMDTGSPDSTNNEVSLLFYGKMSLKI